MQILINGTIQGLLIALIALGFSVVYNSTGIFYIAQGALYALVPFLTLSFINAGSGVTLAVLLTFIISILLSMTFEKINHWPLHRRQASMEVHLISSLGFYIAIIQVIAIIWGNETKVLRTGIDITYKISDIILTKSQVTGGIVSLAIVILFFIWLKKTYLGLKFMALSDNPVQLSLLGYDIANLRLLAFALSGIFTASASILIALDIGFDPHGGLNAVLLGVVATIIGGKGSCIGPAFGGVLLGIVRAQVVWHTSARWENMITFLILVIFLFFRPQGIFGKKGRLEVL